MRRLCTQNIEIYSSSFAKIWKNMLIQSWLMKKVLKYEHTCPLFMKPSNFQTLYTFLLFSMRITTCHMASHEWSNELRSGKQCVAKLNTVKQVKQARLWREPQLPKWPSGDQMASLHFFLLKKRFSFCMAVQYCTVIFTASIYYGTIC